MNVETIKEHINTTTSEHEHKHEEVKTERKASSAVDIINDAKEFESYEIVSEENNKKEVHDEEKAHSLINEEVISERKISEVEKVASRKISEVENVASRKVSEAEKVASRKI